MNIVDKLETLAYICLYKFFSLEFGRAPHETESREENLRCACVAKVYKRNALSFIHGSRSNSRDGFLSSGTRRNK